MTHDHHANDHDPAAAIAHERAAKDAYFARSQESPIPPAERPGFVGLAYFPVNLRLRIEGVSLAPYVGDGPAEFGIPTSDGGVRAARRVGSLPFELDGQSHALTAYDLSGGEDHALFVPFLDATSGSETYGAGRYLDLEPEADGSYVLDFNAAYNPYCAYSPEFSCPLTPAENRLPVRVEAGERLPHPAAGA